MAAKKQGKSLSKKDMKRVKGGQTVQPTARKAGEKQQDYLVVKLENVQITSYQIGS